MFVNFCLVGCPLLKYSKCLVITDHKVQVELVTHLWVVEKEATLEYVVPNMFDPYSTMIVFQF